MTNSKHKRLTDRDIKLNKKIIYEYIGEEASSAWDNLTKWIIQNYEIKPETVFYGKNYGWLTRFRKSNRTLCSLFPEEGCFTFLITYGKKEVAKFLELKEEFHEQIRKVFDSTEQLHDGRWLYIRIFNSELVSNIKKMIEIKRRIKI